MDSDGHFNVAHEGDRKAVFNLIENISDGDAIVNTYDPKEIETIRENLSGYCCKQWKDIVSNFIQRGQLEYVEIPDKAPILCACSQK